MKQIDQILSLMKPNLSDINYDQLKQVLEVVLNPVHLDKSNDELIQQYLSHCRYLEHTECSIARVSCSLNHLSKNLKCNIIDADYHILQDYFVQYKKERNVSARTLNTLQAYVAGLYKYLYNEELINKNPMLRIEKIKEPKEQKPNYTEEEIQKLRDVSTDCRTRALLEFLLSTGCRRSEVINLKIEDVDFINKTAFIKCGKGRKDRTVFFDSVAEKYLKEYLNIRNNPKTGWLFVAYDPHHNIVERKLGAGVINSIFYTCEKQANLTGVHPHKCRHYCISKLIRNGMRPELVAKQAGHSSIGTTLNVYTNVVIEDVKEAYLKAMN